MSVRIQPKQYAQLLFELTKGKTENEITLVLSDFVKVLRKKHHTKYLHHIIRLFEDIYNKENNILSVKVESAEPLDAEGDKNIADYVEKTYPGKEIFLTKKIVPQLKGGVMIRVGDKMIDGSVVKNIVKFRQALRIG
ncbi:ATP synthase F1 subunit delta [Candidatus Nomurabacteria bacterium]|nr:ATP synthase F1 subunit delta [Candidatus Kaiserbacteria bacterium]MCB9814132.1 ATP synthase F1 subunit delta [Candidatus Nomurabacteria bacterium]